jgi:hypothetical protein
MMSLETVDSFVSPGPSREWAVSVAAARVPRRPDAAGKWVNRLAGTSRRQIAVAFGRCVDTIAGWRGIDMRGREGQPGNRRIVTDPRVGETELDETTLTRWVDHTDGFDE